MGSATIRGHQAKTKEVYIKTWTLVNNNEMILFIIVTIMLILNVKIGENEYGV